MKKIDPTFAKKAKKYKRLVDRGFKAASLAHAYIEDGALISGARLLREAARAFERAHGAKNDLMGVTPEPAEKK